MIRSRDLGGIAPEGPIVVLPRGTLVASKGSCDGSGYRRTNSILRFRSS